MSTIFGRVSLQKDLWEKDLARVYKESLDLITLKLAPAILEMPSIPIEELDDPSVPEVYKNAIKLFQNISPIVATGILFSYIRASRPVIFSEWSWDSEKTKQVDIPFISVKPSAEEIFDGFKMVCPLAVPIIIDQLDCTLQEKQLLKSAYNDNQRDSFIEGINSLTCDISVLNFFSTSLVFERWFFIMIFTNPEAIIDVVYHADQFNLSKIIKDSFIGEEELAELDRIYKELESLRGKPHKNESGKEETHSPEQEEEARANAEQMVSGVKKILVETYNTFKQFEGQFFPFEKKYYNDLLELPGVQTIINDIAEEHRNDSLPGVRIEDQKQDDKGQPSVIDGDAEKVTKKRSIDDFDFVKDADFDALYKCIEDVLLLYDVAPLKVFCGNCRLPLETALYEFYHIAGINNIPDLPAGMISRLSMLLPDDLFPLSYRGLYSDLNQLTCKYLHYAKHPPKDEWHEDANKCYRLMIQCFIFLVEFKKEFPLYIEKYGPIDYQKVLGEKLAAKRILPRFNSVSSSSQPDYASIALAHVNLQESYRVSLEKDDCPTIISEIYNETKDTYDYMIDVLSSSISLNPKDASLEYLIQNKEFVPRLLAIRHLHTYLSLIHPILFRESWTPHELAHEEFAGPNPYTDDIVWGLTHINKYASKKVIDKLRGHELTRKQIKVNIDDGGADGLKGFRANIAKLPENDVVVLDNIGHFRLFLIERDCGALLKIKEHVAQCILDKMVSAEGIVKTVNALILSILTELFNATKNKDWGQFFSFEQKYVLDILAAPEAQPFLDELRKHEERKQEDASMHLKSTVFGSDANHTDNKPISLPSVDITDYKFILPADLFSGKVDINLAFIPGLKNALKDFEVFEPLFNFILRLGSICTDKEAGALLRVFTGYPVENANDKAKWETDYHILYYLVKNMFTPKKSYVKMSECIDIYYPSEDERQKAEKSPSSYAERISGNDAPSIIETLHRLSRVFPKPEAPLTD